MKYVSFILRSNKLKRVWHLAKRWQSRAWMEWLTWRQSLLSSLMRRMRWNKSLNMYDKTRIHRFKIWRINYRKCKISTMRLIKHKSHLKSMKRKWVSSINISSESRTLSRIIRTYATKTTSWLVSKANYKLLQRRWTSLNKKPFKPKPRTSSFKWKSTNIRIPIKRKRWRSWRANVCSKLSRISLSLKKMS